MSVKRCIDLSLLFAINSFISFLFFSTALPFLQIVGTNCYCGIVRYHLDWFSSLLLNQFLLMMWWLREKYKNNNKSIPWGWRFSLSFVLSLVQLHCYYDNCWHCYNGELHQPGTTANFVVCPLSCKSVSLCCCYCTVRTGLFLCLSVCVIIIIWK